MDYIVVLLVIKTLVHLCGCKHNGIHSCFLTCVQYSQLVMVVEICEQDLHALKGAYPLIWPLPLMVFACDHRLQ